MHAETFCLVNDSYTSIEMSASVKSMVNTVSRMHLCLP